VTADNRLAAWKRKAEHLRQETYAVCLAYRDPRVPWYGKALAAGVVAYALSPIDLIPDFIPILGYLDDLILIPLGVGLVLKLIPPDVMAECRQQAHEAMAEGRPTNWAGGVVIVVVWLVLAALALVVILRVVRPSQSYRGGL
jgi:uncharacterized membrane protein YkvA (DUF1232 family)